MAELLTWGDQHEPAIFDFFVEKRVRRDARVLYFDLTGTQRVTSL